jgi:hypothetical protein
MYVSAAATGCKPTIQAYFACMGAHLPLFSLSAYVAAAGWKLFMHNLHVHVSFILNKCVQLRLS